MKEKGETKKSQVTVFLRCIPHSLYCSSSLHTVEPPLHPPLHAWYNGKMEIALAQNNRAWKPRAKFGQMKWKTEKKGREEGGGWLRCVCVKNCQFLRVFDRWRCRRATTCTETLSVLWWSSLRLTEGSNTYSLWWPMLSMPRRYCDNRLPSQPVFSASEPSYLRSEILPYKSPYWNTSICYVGGMCK